MSPAMHLLIIRQRKDAVHILKIVFHKHLNIRKLILKGCWLGESSNGLLANIVDLYPDLDGLSLVDRGPLTPASYGLIPRLKKISELELSDWEALSGTTVRLITDSCRHLKKLSLNGGRQVADDDVVYVFKKLGKQLTTLVLNGTKLTDVVYIYLNNCARLQNLEVSYCVQMTDKGLLEGIGSLHKLTSLRLSTGHNLTAATLSMFFHRPSMTSIVLLNLSFFSNLHDEGLKGIAKRCIHLKELAVCWCRNVTDAGVSMVISHCSQLRVLNLRGLPSITGEGWLALVPLYLPHLRQLCLELCHNMVRKYLEEFVAAVPELEIII